MTTLFNGRESRGAARGGVLQDQARRGAAGRVARAAAGHRVECEENRVGPRAEGDARHGRACAGCRRPHRRGRARSARAPATAIDECSARAHRRASGCATGPGRGTAPGRLTAPAVAPRAVLAPLAADRHLLKITITLSADARARLDRARDLLRHVLPTGDPALIVERALNGPGRAARGREVRRRTPPSGAAPSRDQPTA